MWHLTILFKTDFIWGHIPWAHFFFGGDSQYFRWTHYYRSGLFNLQHIGCTNPSGNSVRPTKEPKWNRLNIKLLNLWIKLNKKHQIKTLWFNFSEFLRHLFSSLFPTMVEAHGCWLLLPVKRFNWQYAGLRLI